MAVTLTPTDLAAAMRLGDGTAPAEPLAGILTRLLGVASATVELLAPGAPEGIQNESAILFCAYVYDQPEPTRGGAGFASAWNNSGAAGIVAPWRVRRAGGAATDTTVTPSAGNPVTGLEVTGGELIATFADGEVERLTLPSGDYVLPAAAPGVRGGVAAITNTIVDDAAMAPSTIFGWSKGHVRRLIETIVPLWARAEAPPVDQTARDAAATNTREAARQQMEIEANRASAADARRVAVANQASFSNYRVAADQDIIDSRHTQGVTLARQEARTADGKAVAAQEAIPERIPDAPAAAAADKKYELQVPASGESSWQEASASTGGPGVDATARRDIAAETTAREAADAALDLRIDAVARDFVLEPNYWLRTSDARTFVLHLHPEAIPTGATRIRLAVQGQPQTVALVSGDTDYSFTFDATQAANALRNIGSRTTLQVTLSFLNAAGTSLGMENILIRVLADVPGDIDQDARDAAAAAQTAADSKFVFVRKATEGDLSATVPANTVEWYPE